MQPSTISEKRRRIAKNTGFMYMRMLILTVIGFFTSRILLDSLGVGNYGTYNAVYAVVMLFTMASNGVGNSISRYMAVELAGNDMGRLRNVVSSAIIIQATMAVLLVLIAETAGIWYVRHRLDIPQESLGAALWVFRASVLMLIIQMFSTVYNSLIIAHEDMSAFAYISILEGVLKLSVALFLYISRLDKLITYAVLTVTVAFVVRSCYAVFCRRHYRESRGSIHWDRRTVSEMLSFSGWSFLGNAVGTLNVHGISLLANSFFGIGVNAAKGIAIQVENITKQFVSNFMTALNPQIMKSYTNGEEEYCYVTVSKGCKIAYLIMLTFVLPFIFESNAILEFWLKEVPVYAPEFTRMALVCILLEMMANPILQLIQTTGKISGYYVATSVLGLQVFIFSWIGFKNGMLPVWSYYVYAAVCFLSSVTKVIFAVRLAGFPIRRFIGDVVFKVLVVTLLSILVTWVVKAVLPSGLWFSLAVAAISAVSVCVFSYLIATTSGERSFIKETLWKK